MKVNMPMAVTAADTIKRTITGTIVSWDEQGNTSVGQQYLQKIALRLSQFGCSLSTTELGLLGKWFLTM